MRVQIKRKNLRRLASLSALGAGALAATAGTAEADVVHVTENQALNWNDPTFGPAAPIQVSLPGGAGFSVFGSFCCGFQYLSTGLAGKPTPRGTTFYYIFRRRYAAFVYMHGKGGLQLGVGKMTSGVPAGRTWNGVGRIGTLFRVAFGHDSTRISSGPRGFLGPTLSLQSYNFGGKLKYFLFQFPDNGKTLYGWGQLALGSDFEVTLVDIAYDTTGATIAAGQTSVPEPSETVPLALSALVLGAAGIRRWRAAKAS